MNNSLPPGPSKVPKASQRTHSVHIDSRSQDFDTSSHTGWIWPVLGATKAAAHTLSKVLSSLVTSRIKPTEAAQQQPTKGGVSTSPLPATSVEDRRAACIERLQVAFKEAGVRRSRSTQAGGASSVTTSQAHPSSVEWSGEAGLGIGSQGWAVAMSKRRKAEDARANKKRLGRPQIVGVSGAAANRIKTARIQEDARNLYWSLSDEAVESGDYKVHSRLQDWRHRMLEANRAVFRAVQVPGEKRPFRQAAKLIRSRCQDGRAQQNQNPARVAATVQPALREGLMTQEEAQRLVDLSATGVTIQDFRDLEGDALDLSVGNTEEHEDEEVLLDFYFEQLSVGRLVMLPADMREELEHMGELVISPSFLVKATGKKPRAILHLSSTEMGVNQRILDDLRANKDGYSTVKDIATMVVQAFIGMVLTPGKYNLENIMGVDFTLIVMDGDAAYFRQSVSAEIVGVQCARVRSITAVLLCCSFGWRRSAEIFSHVTAGVQCLHASQLDDSSFLAENVERAAIVEEQSEVGRLLADSNPEHGHVSCMHVDDACALETLLGLRPKASAADLAWAIKVFLGVDGLSLKKFKASSFWSELQRIIGAWFCVDTFTVTMPTPKILEAIAILESDHFAKSATEFEIDICATLNGKLNWCTYSTPMGSVPCLINIEKQRMLGATGRRKVKPTKFLGEDEATTLAKFHNDLNVRLRFLKAAAANPHIATCSMLSLMDLEDRLQVPGQSQSMAWISGDFSKKGQSFGVEVLHPTRGLLKFWSFLPHPEKVSKALELAMKGKATKGSAIVSTVLERQNKLMAEFQWRELLAGIAQIVLDDNTGSVACVNNNYSQNRHCQAMQLASSLRLSLDEAAMKSYFTSTKNMSFFDRTSRDDMDYADRFNAKLEQAGMQPWVYQPPVRDSKAISHWLEENWDEDLPMLDSLLEGLEEKSVKQTMPVCSLDPALIASKPDLRWQDRVAAAAEPMQCSMGSFGPNAYCREHLCNQAGANTRSLSQLMKVNRDRAGHAGCISMIDAYAGGGGATVAGIRAGLFVKATYEVAQEEIAVLENLTGQRCLGPVRSYPEACVPGSNMWVSCSVCKDYCTLGSKKGLKGSKGGNEFPLQSRMAKQSGSMALVWENVNGVAKLNNGEALTEFKKNSRKDGFTKQYHKQVVFALHGDPENRSRTVGVSFSHKVKNSKPFNFPPASSNRKCSGEVIKCSTLVPARFWDDRAWHRTSKGWRSTEDGRIFTLGYCNLLDRVGQPMTPSRVFCLLGLFPTCLASGNTGLVLTFCMRALCPLYTMFCAWARPQHKGTNRGRQKGGQRKRRVMPCECLESKGYPACKGLSDTVAYRMAGNMVPVNYFEKLLKAVAAYLEESEVDLTLEEKPRAHCTLLAEDLQRARQQAAMAEQERVQSGLTHPLMAVVANKQDPAVEFFAQASAEALTAEEAVQEFQGAMAVERTETGKVAQSTAKAAEQAAKAVKAAKERIGAAEDEVAYWRHWQQRIEISTRPESVVESIMPKKDEAMAERQLRQMREAMKEFEEDSAVKATSQELHESLKKRLTKAQQERCSERFGVKVGAKVKKGNNLVNGLSREDCERLPVSVEELKRMSAKREDLRFGKYAKGSKKQIEMGIRHWYSFCARFEVPRFLMTNTVAGIRAATAQAEMFILYELSNFDITAAAVNQKLWAVDKDHQAHRIPAPFKDNEVVREMIKDAIKRDAPSKSKMPITDRQMEAVKDSLNLSSRQGFTFWTGLRFAIAMLCRVSEWAINEEHTLTWRSITFFGRDRQPMEVQCEADIALVHEMEVIFYTDKTHGEGDGVVRNFFAIEDVESTKCIVRDMAALWLISERIDDNAIFSWDNGSKGVTRSQVNSILKVAAEAVGMKASDTGSHSCRITGLCRLLSQGMSITFAREHGRWSRNSTCVFKYFWPHTSMAKEFAALIWESACYSRVRGGGEVQHLF